MKEIWTEFKDRITSPFFGSFVLSWFIYNWQIPLVLIFYKLDDLVKAKTTYIDFILRYKSVEYMIVWPLVSAFLYTFLYPHFKRLINTYTAIQTLKTDTKLLKLGETAPVSQQKFLSMHAELKKNRNELATLLIEESSTKIKNDELEAMVEVLHLKISDINTSHQENISALTKSNTEQITNINLSNDRNVTEINGAHQDRINVIRHEHTEALNRLQDEITVRDGMISTIRTDIDRVMNNEQNYLDQLGQKEQIINDLNEFIHVKDENQQVLQGLIVAKDVELTNKDLTMGNVQNAFRNLVRKDNDSLILGMNSLQTIMNANEILLSEDRRHMINMAFLSIRRRLDDLQREIALDPQIQSLTT